MTQEIRLGAILARDERILLVRGTSGAWDLPGGPFRQDHEDVDLGMAEYLLDFGVRIPDIEESFLQTAYVPRPGGGHVVLNLYAPAEWEGEPRGASVELSWHEIDALAATDMDPGTRHALLVAFGLAQDDAETRIASAFTCTDEAATPDSMPGAAGLGPRPEATNGPSREPSPPGRPAQPPALSTQRSTYDWFIASRWRNAEAVDALAAGMRDAGLRVYCFRDAGDDWNVGARESSADEYMAAFEARDWRTDPFVRRVFEADIEALRSAAALVLLLPAGTSSHMEAGIAFVMGKPCVLVGATSEAESLYLMFDAHYPTAEAFVEALR